MKKIILYLLVISMIAILGVGCTQSEEVPQDEIVEENYVPVEIETSKVDTIFQSVAFSGKVFADKEVMVLPKMMGKVNNLRVKVGDKVTKGNTLFTLNKDDIQKQVDQAKLALDSATKGFEANKEKIENAKVNLERTEKLYLEGAVSKSQYEQAQLAASDKSLEAAKTQINQAQMAYDQAKDALDNAIVAAPISGTVASVNIEEGEYATNAQPAMTIVDMNSLYVGIDVTENMLGKINEGQEVEVEISSLGEEGFSGKITSISPTSDVRTQLYSVKINIDTDKIVRPGMFAKATLKTNIRENVIIVRSEAIIEKSGKSVVYVVQDDKAVEKEVTMGLDSGQYTEITSGLNEGENVIVKGQNYVENNGTIKVVGSEE